MPNPPDHWLDFPSDGLTDAQVLQKLNEISVINPPSAAFEKQCTNGKFIFVGLYAAGKQQAKEKK